MPHARHPGHGPLVALIAGIVLVTTGCASLSADRGPGAGLRRTADADGLPPLLEVTLTQVSLDDADPEDYDPWERFNEAMFTFNYNLDRYAIKPAAKVYGAIIPEPFQIVIANGFDNLRSIPRVVNSLLQAKWGGAGREASRFLINSTAGIGGLFDPAKDYWGIEKSEEDFGQTLAVWGLQSGPYLVLPLLPPMTVRDGVGRGVDGVMNPLTWVLPFIWTRLGMQLGDTVNDRALNVELFEGFEEGTLDLYSAVRDAYLRRRELMIRR